MNIEIKEKNEDTSEPSGMIVAVRIKPLDDKHETDMSIQSVGHNLLKVLLYEPKTYQFDYVHWSTKTSMDYPSYVTQEMVFDTIGQPIVQNSSLGYNCSLFAYGQTGSGKTYTMLGEKNDEGLIPRVCRALMTAPLVEGSVRTFKITYVEIFLEKVRDLLRGNQGNHQVRQLKVREHPTDGPFVEGAISAEILTYDECMKLMDFGSRNRMVATTKMNEQSSRSHAIFTIISTVTKKLNDSEKNQPSEGEDVYTVVSKINLIDLAGSENAISAGSTGDRLKEGAAINKSLLTLGRVIKVLAENSTLKNHQKHVRRSTVGYLHEHRGDSSTSNGNSTPTLADVRHNTSERRSSQGNNTPSLKRISSHGGETGMKKASLIPYRDSVLTYLLKDSLGGNSKTTMIATIRPGIQYGEETANTLRYAAQAKKIVNVVTVNENPYVKMIKKLQQEVEELTKKLQTIRPTSPHQLIAETPSHQDEGNSFDSTPLKGSPANMAESLENDQVASNEQPILDIPRLVRQFTSPNDEGTSESPLVVSDEIDAAEDKSQDDSDIFSSDGESTHGDDVSKSNHEPPNFGSPIRTRQQAEDKFPQLLTSLQKKLLMVRQTSLEVSETFDRLSSPSKKSQNRPNYASFQLLESDLKNDESDDEPVDADTNDKTETPYRPVALFRDLNDEGDETKLPESTPNLTDSSLPENDNPSNTSIQQSPVVVLYDNVSTKSPLPLVAAPSTISSSQNDNHPTNSTTSTPQQKESRMSQSSRASCESDLSQHVLKEGFLMKRGFINKAFQRRWCVLKGKDIYYYKQYRDKDVRGKINCSQALVVRAENRKDELPFAFYIHTPQDSEHKKWLLQAASEDEMISWISAIEHVAQSHHDDLPDHQITTENCDTNTCIIA